MDGILPLWKQRGMTSHDCIYKLRKILGMKKIGHAGTLDPDVDGVLPVALGKGTKVLEFMTNNDKTYTGEITLGFSTTTEDSSGETVEKMEINPSSIDIGSIDQSMSEMTGELAQVPPLYSAVKVNGKKLYEYARNGESVVRPERKVEIYNFYRTSDLTFNKANKTLSFHFKVECGKGTFVRTLAVDLGKKLGVPSHMSSLTRNESSGIDGESAITLESVKEMRELETLNDVIVPIEKVLKEYNSYHLSEEEWNMVRDGRVFYKEDFLDFQFPLIFYYNEYAVAVYYIHPEKNHLIKPKKVLRREL